MERLKPTLSCGPGAVVDAQNMKTVRASNWPAGLRGARAIYVGTLHHRNQPIGRETRSLVIPRWPDTRRRTSADCCRSTTRPCR
jgi:hypothetical protein